MKAAREKECLRQERIAFEVRRSQSRWWFWLRFATVIVLLALSVGVFAIGAWILLSPEAYSTAVLKGTGIAVMVDLLAIGGTTFAHTLRPTSQPILGPVTIKTDNG